MLNERKIRVMQARLVNPQEAWLKKLRVEFRWDLQDLLGVSLMK
jgi:hypothetical protein